MLAQAFMSGDQCTICRLLRLSFALEEGLSLDEGGSGVIICMNFFNIILFEMVLCFENSTWTLGYNSYLPREIQVKVN